jgi:nucleoside-diphosphate-sugar epimerase
MRIVVLGAGGYLGSELCKELSKDFDNFVIGIDKTPATYCNKIIQCDLTDSVECKKVLGDIEFDVMYQMAADSGNKAYLDSAAYMYGTSTLINLNVLSAINKDSKGLVVFPSSFYAGYPEDAYGAEKYYNELLYIRSKFNTIVFRLSPVYGYYNGVKTSEKVLNSFCKQIARATDGYELRVKSDEYLRAFVYIDDAVKEIIKLSKQENVKRRIELVSEYPISLYQLALLIKVISKKNVSIINETDPSSKLKVPNIKFMADYRVYTATPVKEGIKIVYDEYEKLSLSTRF